MVDFETFFEVVHETATRKGLQGEGTGPRRQNLTRELSEFWQSNKPTVQSWTKAEAREWAEQNVDA